MIQDDTEAHKAHKLHAYKEFDFFISYKRSDSSDFSAELHRQLEALGYKAWLDDIAIDPGASIVDAIESGLRNSKIAIPVCSTNYGKGWANHERRVITHRMIQETMRCVPVLFRVDHTDVSLQFPLLADLKALSVSAVNDAEAVASKLKKLTIPRNPILRLQEELIFLIYEISPYDDEVALMRHTLANDTEKALEALDRDATGLVPMHELIHKYRVELLKNGHGLKFAELINLVQRHNNN